VCDGNDVGRPTFLRLFYFNRPTRDYLEYAIIRIFYFFCTAILVPFTNIIYIVSGEIASTFRRGIRLGAGAALSAARAHGYKNNAMLYIILATLGYYSAIQYNGNRL